MKRNATLLALLFSATCSLASAWAEPVDIEALISKMTVEEKFGQLQQVSGFGFTTGPGAKAEADKQMAQIRAGGCGSILNSVGAEVTNRLQRVAVEESRLHIPILFGFDVIHGHRTVFPNPLGESASFDPKTCEETAAAAAEEAYAQGVRWTFAPMVDVARDARWGRVMEGAGEDTYLGCQLATARVKGFQRGGKFAACAKHFVAYGAAEAGRDYNTVDVSERSLREVYFPPFKACVDAGVMTFMTSFNEVSGTPSTANRFVMTDVLRGEWKFPGFVVSDYDAVEELKHHGLAADSREAALRGLMAGCDMEMSSTNYMKEGAALVREGKLPIEVVNESVRRILRIKKQLGLWENPYTKEDGEQAKLLTPAHRSLARTAAARSMVLLKNDKGVLPLSPTVKSVAIIGPHGNNQADIIGAWHGAGRAEDAVTLLQGIKQKLPGASVSYVQGCDFFGKLPVDKAGVNAAIASAEVVIVAVGEAESQSGEAKSRSDIGLSGNQLELIKLVHASGKPYVVTLMNGRPLALGWVADNSPAILEAWFPGTEGGSALADVLFGDVNPGGKLPMSFPRVVGQVPIYYNHKNTGRPTYLRPEYVSNYQDVPNDPQYAFGHGLSYTSFTVSNPLLSSATIGADGTVTVRATVTNTGTRAGDEVVQCYVRDRAATVTRPVRELKGFQRVALQPGEKREVTFTLGQRELGFYDQTMKWVVEPGEFDVFVGNSSNAEATARFTVR